VCVAVLLVLASWGAFAVASPSSPALTSSPHCGPATARTLAASSEARVYSLAGLVYGCAPGSGHRYRLGNTSQCNSSNRVGPVAVAAKLAAYASERCGIDTGSTLVEVRRLSDDRGLFSHPASSLSIGPEGFQAVGSIVIDRRGELAWIVSQSSLATHRHQTQVVEAGGSGVHVLETGTSIQGSSLRLHGSKLTWKAGGSERSAKLG